MAVVTSATEVGNTRPSAASPESVARIHEVSFYSLTSSIWDDLAAGADAAPSPGSYPDMSDLTSMRDNYGQGATGAPVFEHPCLPLTKIMSSGSFYYALEPYWDLSSRLSQRLPTSGSTETAQPKDMGNFDERFVWNEYIVRSLLDFRDRLDTNERGDLDRCQFIVSRSQLCAIVSSTLIYCRF